MPKNRKRVLQKGGKSVSIRTKHKIGGRKASKGTNEMSNTELTGLLNKVNKRDRNKLRRAILARFKDLPS